MYSKKQLSAIYWAIVSAENIVEAVCTTDILKFEEETIHEIWRDLNKSALKIIAMQKEEDRTDV